MKLRFLGTGTSVGIPVIGCDCKVCTSPDPRNARTRASVQISSQDTSIIVDTPPDFRLQVLHAGIRRVDAVLFTHSHADHIFGFDDIRRFNTIQDAMIPAYAPQGTIDDLKRIFDYVSAEKGDGGYRPLTEFRLIAGDFRVGDIEVAAVPVVHDQKPCHGFIFRHRGVSVGYAPDCGTMPEASLQRFKGVDVMVLDALRYRPHRTHMTVEQSVQVLGLIGATRSYLTHMCHEVEHGELQLSLGRDMFVAYDGLVLEV